MTTYRGVVCHQTEDFREVLSPILKEISPELIVELGTSYGGLTLFLLDLLPDTKVFTFEQDTSKPNEHLKWYKRCNVVIGNIWRRNDLNQAVRHYLTVPRRKLVLVDGGDKIKEFHAAAKHLRSGDVIAAHDYCVSKDVYDTQYAETVWHWLEITYDDIFEVCNKYKLIPVYLETHRAMWGFFRKA